MNESDRKIYIYSLIIIEIILSIILLYYYFLSPDLDETTINCDCCKDRP